MRETRFHSCLSIENQKSETFAGCGSRCGIAAATWLDCAEISICKGRCSRRSERSNAIIGGEMKQSSVSLRRCGETNRANRIHDRRPEPLLHCNDSRFMILWASSRAGVGPASSDPYESRSQRSFRQFTRSDDAGSCRVNRHYRRLSCQRSCRLLFIWKKQSFISAAFSSPNYGVVFRRGRAERRTR